MAQLGNNVVTGTNVSDFLEVSLFDATVDLTDADSTGAAVRVDKPGDVQLVLVLSAISGTTPELTVTVQASNAEAFDDDVVTVGTLRSTGATDDNNVYGVSARIDKTWVRAVNNMTGTSPDYTGAELYVRPKHWHRTTSTSAAPIV